MKCSHGLSRFLTIRTIPLIKSTCTCIMKRCMWFQLQHEKGHLKACPWLELALAMYIYLTLKHKNYVKIQNIGTDQSPPKGAVWLGPTTICLSGCIFWMHSCIIQPNCSILRPITIIILSIPVNKIWTVYQLKLKHSYLTAWL